jgi:hypothetical protein
MRDISFACAGDISREEWDFMGILQAANDSYKMVLKNSVASFCERASARF